MHKIEPYYSYATNIKNNEKAYSAYLLKNFGAKTRIEAKQLNNGKYIPSSWELAIRKTSKLFLQHLWEVMWVLDNKGSIPRPMHYPNIPLDDNEMIIPPFFPRINKASYMSKTDSIKYYQNLP